MEFSTITVEKNKVDVKKPKQYKVIMFNDDFTTMEFVVAILMDIFSKTIDEANKVMIDVHKKGSGIAGIYPYDIAVTKVTKAMNIAKEEGFPFKLSMEEV